MHYCYISMKFNWFVRFIIFLVCAFDSNEFVQFFPVYICVYGCGWFSASTFQMRLLCFVRKTDHSFSIYSHTHTIRMYYKENAYINKQQYRTMAVDSLFLADEFGLDCSLCYCTFIPVKTLQRSQHCVNKIRIGWGEFEPQPHAGLPQSKRKRFLCFVIIVQV